MTEKEAEKMIAEDKVFLDSEGKLWLNIYNFAKDTLAQFILEYNRSQNTL